MQSRATIIEQGCAVRTLLQNSLQSVQHVSAGAFLGMEQQYARVTACRCYALTLKSRPLPPYQVAYGVVLDCDHRRALAFSAQPRFELAQTTALLAAKHSRADLRGCRLLEILVAGGIHSLRKHV